MGQKDFWVQNILVKQNVGPRKLKAPKKLGPNSLVKIGSVIAEIFMPWTNVARTNVAWTNVSKTVDNSYRWPYQIWI